MIPFNRPVASGNELEYVSQVLRSNHWCGDGIFTDKCQKLLGDLSGAEKVLLTTSCTDALEMTGLLLNMQPGDEIIVPSFTFVSSINAFVLRGAVPRFVDVRPDTLNIDEKLIERYITNRTKAILVVHYAGVSCEMDSILALAKMHGIAVIEDNAHGLFGSYKGRKLGSMGRMATLSFHETKNIAAGEGGALLLNDLSDVERAEILREKGTNRKRFLRGQVDKYTWVDLGSSFLPSEIIAAVLYGQLEQWQKTQQRRAAIWQKYANALEGWASKLSMRLPHVPQDIEQSFHMFYMIAPSFEVRTKLIAHLKGCGVQATFHYQSLHMSEMGKKLGGKQGDCPVTEAVSDQLLRLPLWAGLRDEDQGKIIEAVISFRV